MKIQIWLASAILLLLGSSPIFAKGVDSSGGGSSLVASFVTSAQALIEKVNFEPEHRTALLRALQTSRIVTAKVLKDEAMRPIAEQGGMLAYASSGFIQLKEASGSGGDSWELATLEKRSVAHIVIHELFRATGLTEDGRSVDDTYQLSVLRYRLNQLDNLGFPLSEAVELHYWKCQCFQSETEGSPSGGMNLIGLDALMDAERAAARSCRKDLISPKTIARCHKYVGDPHQN